ncbi:MAG TPA: hypothetical protein VHW23_14975 [Kofleriaceae bacterium]|nr:hypothetical protein [Kofleriaceae bacterium]
MLIASCGGDSSPALLPAITDHGGPVMAHPQLVPIFYPGDADIATLTSFSQWIVGSQWLKDVGADYGVSTGSVLQVVQRADAAPAMIDDTDIVTLLYSGLADGSLPKPTGGLASVVYMIHFPATTLVTAGGSMSCVDFGGYHNSARQNGVELSYAVIATCPGFVDGLSDVEDREVVASHELIETATDPIPDNHPGFQLGDPASSWFGFGTEVADLCERPDTTEVWRESGFVAQRSWSTTAAAAEHDPCIPGASADYFNLVAQPSKVLRIAPGGHAQVTLRAWASGAARGTTWQLEADGAMMDAQTLTLSATTIKDGGTVSLDVALPQTAQVGDQPEFVVFSSASATSYSILPMYAVAGVPCSQLTACDACTFEFGCGFCTSSGKCEAVGGETSSAESSCSGSSFATWPGNCPGYCARFSDSCTDCSSQPGCGWCASGQPQCVEASHDTGQPLSGSCPYADWSFTPDYCSQ